MNRIVLAVLVVTLMFMTILVASCQVEEGLFPYKKWTVSKPIFKAGTQGTFDDISVKDPTIVFYNGQYHLFYTSKAIKETASKIPYLSRGRSGVGYVAAPTLEGLQEAQRHNLDAIVETIVVAPQVFYFEPQKLWYLIAQTTVDGKPDLMPIYLTNPDIEDVHGW